MGTICVGEKHLVFTVKDAEEKSLEKLGLSVTF